jgi:copper chaperone NosL
MKKTNFLIFLVFLFSFCAPKAPIDIQAGKEECIHCKMKIVDLKFNTQVQTDKGKIYHFDSVECLVDWLNQNPDQKIKNAWIKDYVTSEWVEYKNAVYFVSPEIPSPMGKNISGYKSEDEIKKLNKPGDIYKYDDLVNYLKSQSQKDEEHHHH